jgi:hypothetical protein
MNEQEYHVSDFTYLIRTKHNDRENSLEYEAGSLKTTNS